VARVEIVAMATQEDENTNWKRKGLVVVLAILVSGGLLVTLSSSSVMAATLTVRDDSVITDNGALTSITVDVSGDVTWDGAENQPGQTDVELQIQSPDGTWETLATEDAGTLSGLAGSYSYSFTDVDIKKSSWNKGDFQAGGDGSSKETDLSFRVVVTPSGDLDGDGSTVDTIQSSSDTATVTVENEPNSNSADGGGSVDASGTNKEP
jgi:hypothetical protein